MTVSSLKTAACNGISRILREGDAWNEAKSIIKVQIYHETLPTVFRQGNSKVGKNGGETGDQGGSQNSEIQDSILRVRFPLLCQLNTTTRTLCGVLIFMETLNFQSEWKDNCFD